MSFGGRSIVKSIVAVDNLAIQRSLTVLEDRFRALREMGETRFQALEAEKAAAAKSAEELKQQLAAQTEATQQAQKARDEQASRVKTLEAKLAQQTGTLAVIAEALPRLRQLAHQPTP